MKKHCSRAKSKPMLADSLDLFLIFPKEWWEPDDVNREAKNLDICSKSLE